MRDKEWVNPGKESVEGFQNGQHFFGESLDKNCLSVFYGTHAVAFSRKNKHLKKGEVWGSVGKKGEA